ncbi:MarR family transcriptional regulator [Altericroceibacterium spongiae]|uniref:MarR family transcriptional regulator n=1 Tax=Altericroceibacterium spongiae TaxID=2320269 RepID=A0A420EMD8_9SPHN|nr:winged helix DNA-binding protein [Altericroceibacterium spongiae]RKF21810.1 MarR family transcriptional regulator [Altericroceibacterium spongiae]
MLQADFDYRPAGEPGAPTLSVSVHADRPYIRDAMREDIEAAGFFLKEAGSAASLLHEPDRPLSDVILLDCPRIDARDMAALARLDQRIARSGTRLIVSTGMETLDAVFGSFGETDTQILVDPTRSDRVIALGQLLAKMPGMRVRELAEEERMAILRMTEQINQIARKLEGLGCEDFSDGKSSKSVFSFGLSEDSGNCEGDRLVRATRPSLPDPRLVRQIIRHRQLRARFFDGDLFADPAWDILLDLTAARAEHNRVSVTSLCIASGVPPTTALRWISQMTEAELLKRLEDETDRRRAFIVLTERAADAMARYFQEVGKEAVQFV